MSNMALYKALTEAGTSEELAQRAASSVVDPERFATKADLAPFATKADLAPFATKADLAPFATKADLAPFATKADLAPFATKADLAPFATKADLAPFVTKADLAPFATKAELEGLKQSTRADLARLELRLVGWMAVLMTISFTAFGFIQSASIRSVLPAQAHGQPYEQAKVEQGA